MTNYRIQLNNQNVRHIITVGLQMHKTTLSECELKVTQKEVSIVFPRSMKLHAKFKLNAYTGNIMLLSIVFSDH